LWDQWSSSRIDELLVKANDGHSQGEWLCADGSATGYTRSIGSGTVAYSSSGDGYAGIAIERKVIAIDPA
jgi:hypothetical protein